MTASYPDDSVQNLCGEWWEVTDEPGLQYGRLVKAFLPHVDQQPSIVVAKGRTDPEAHDEADYEIQPLRRNTPPQEAFLPVAGLPTYPGEVRIIQRAKKRPALVLSTAGAEVEGRLKTGAAGGGVGYPGGLNGSASTSAADRISWDTASRHASSLVGDYEVHGILPSQPRPAGSTGDRRRVDRARCSRAGPSGGAD